MYMIFLHYLLPLSWATECDGKDAEQASGDLVLDLKQLLVISCVGIIPSLNKSLNHG